MPGTARDMAERMGINNPDLQDPVTNLRLGAHYLSGLREGLPSLTHALLAYNAGRTRVRRWIAEYGDLPPVLFVEAVPFAETRNYLRKVLVSATYYGYLYDDVSVRETLKQFFPTSSLFSDARGPRQ
jgi:soluble lytic murein transglycosylase-like protein